MPLNQRNQTKPSNVCIIRKILSVIAYLLYVCYTANQLNNEKYFQEDQSIHSTQG